MHCPEACRWGAVGGCVVYAVRLCVRESSYGSLDEWDFMSVLHGENGASPATPRNQNNDQPSGGQPQQAVQTYRSQTKLQRDTPS